MLDLNMVFLSERKYILDLLAENGMLDCKPIDTPIGQNHRLGFIPIRFLLIRSVMSDL